MIDPVVRAQFRADQGDIDWACCTWPRFRKSRRGRLSGELDIAVDAMKNVPWSARQEFKGDADMLKKIDDEAEALPRTLRRALT